MPAQAVYAGVPQAPWSPHSTYIVELVQVNTYCWPQRGVNPTDHLNLESVHKLPLQQYAEPMLLGALCGPGREGASTGDLREGRGPHLSCAPPRPGAAAPHLRPVFAHCSRPKAVLRCYRCVAGGHHTGQTCLYSSAFRARAERSGLGGLPAWEFSNVVHAATTLHERFGAPRPSGTLQQCMWHALQARDHEVVAKMDALSGGHVRQWGEWSQLQRKIHFSPPQSKSPQPWGRRLLPTSGGLLRLWGWRSPLKRLMHFGPPQSGLLQL